MIGKYKDEIYLANRTDDNILLLTYKQDKRTEGFEQKRNYYKKCVLMKDEQLISLYDIHFWVKYDDKTELETMWNIDEGRPIGIKYSIEDYEIVINVSHDACAHSWIQVEKGSASKKISLLDCTEFFIERVYTKKDGVVLSHELCERVQVNVNTLKDTIIMMRSGNL